MRVDAKKNLEGVIIDKYDNENHLCLAIENNIDSFCEKMFGEKCIKYEREARVADTKLRYDFVLYFKGSLSDIGIDKKVILECKSGCSSSNLMQGYSQLLLYETASLLGLLKKHNGLDLFKKIPVSEMVDSYLVSDVYDELVDCAAMRMYGEKRFIFARRSTGEFINLKDA